MTPLPTRRDFLRSSAGFAAGLAGAAVLGPMGGHAALGFVPDNPKGDRPAAGAVQDKSVEVLYPRARIPLSFIIDDSTCLVNMGHYCMPQFAAAWPQSPEYRGRPWKDWPREIPDAVVREFGGGCAANGVRGQYSIVPYPACGGWLDRGWPGWA